MSLRILYGPKKKALTKAFIKEINQAIEKDHKYRLIVVVPEQFSSYYEETLASDRGFMKAEVMTFSRLTQRLFDLEYIERDNTVNDTGKTMLLYSLLNKEELSLDYYQKSRKYPGFSVLAMQTIKELRANNISYEDILRISENGDFSYATKTKFAEIAAIYELYMRSMKETGLADQTDSYDMLCEHINNTTTFDNSIIWFDRFSFFSAKEFDVIKSLMNKAERINISLCIDYGISGLDSDIFTIPLCTMDKLKEQAKQQKTAFIEERDKTYTEETSKSRSLDFLFSNLFRSRNEISEGAVKDIEIFKAYDIYEEAEYAAIRIMNAVENRGIRYKDILCVVSDVSSYERIIKAVFDQYDIPFYINSKKSIADNPLIKFTISILDIYVWDYDIDSTSRFIKNLYSIIDEEDALKLENYIIKWGISAKKAWHNVWDYENNAYDDRMNRLREKIVDSLDAFFNKVRYGCRPEEFARHLYNLIENLRIYEKTDVEENYTESDGAEQAKQCYDSFIDILDQMVIMPDDEKRTVEYYMNILKTAFMETSVGITPVTKDCVILTNAARADIKDYDTMIVLGVNEGLFPGLSDSKSLFNDSDIERMKQYGYEISTDPSQNAVKEEYQIYELMQSPTRKIYLSYHLHDSEGGDKNMSVWLAKVLAIFPNIEVLTRGDIPEYEYAHNIKTAFSILFNGNTSLEDVCKDTRLEKLLYVPSDTANITQSEMRGMLFGDTMNLSATMLERYVACPYSFLMAYGLKFDERPVFEYFSANLGSLKHSILFDAMSLICDDNIDYTYDEIYAICEHSAEKISRTNNIYKRDSVLEYVKKRAVQQAADTITISLDIMKNEKMRPKYLETKFDENGIIKPLVFKTGNVNVRINGKVDRIDTATGENNEYFRVIDYKTSDNDIALYRIKEGLDIQLALYAYAYHKSVKAQLAGMYYMTIEHKYSKVENSQDNSFEDINKVLPGYSFDDRSGSLSELIDNNTIKKSKVLDSDLQQNIFQSVESTIVTSADNINNGNFAVKPIKDKTYTACKYCPYGMLCGFDSKKDRYRKVEAKKDNEIIW